LKKRGPYKKPAAPELHVKTNEEESPGGTRRVVERLGEFR